MSKVPGPAYLVGPDESRGPLRWRVECEPCERVKTPVAEGNRKESLEGYRDRHNFAHHTEHKHVRLMGDDTK